MRTIRLAATILAMLTLCPAFAHSAQALTPALPLSQSYTQAQYYENLCAAALTGDPRTDIVLVAQSQIGYHESSDPGDLSGTADGSDNCTEYGRCFGTVSDAWCAMFVWWCAAQAGISENIIPHTEWAKTMTYGCPCYSVSQTTAEAGDLVFVDNNGDGLEDHVGIVSGVQDGSILTVEGNVSNCVVTRSYSAATGRCSGSGASILFIGKPDYYNNGASHRETENYIEITASSAKGRSTPSASAAAKLTVYRGERYLLLNVAQKQSATWYQFEVGLNAYWIQSTDAHIVGQQTAAAATTTTTTAATTETTTTTTAGRTTDTAQTTATKATAAESETLHASAAPDMSTAAASVSDGYHTTAAVLPDDTTVYTTIRTRPGSSAAGSMRVMHLVIAAAAVMLLTGALLAFRRKSN